MLPGHRLVHPSVGMLDGHDFANCHTRHGRDWPAHPTHLLKSKMRFSPWSWWLSIWDYLKFAYELLNLTTPNRIALNRTMTSQTKAYMAISAFVAENREQSTTDVNWHSLHFLDFVHLLIFLNMHDILEASFVSVLGKRSTQSVDPWDWTIVSHWAP